MKVLLDTQAFLWLIADTKQLSSNAKKIFLDSNSELFLSLASIWEIAIKISIKKLTLQQSFERFIPHQLQENNISQLHIDFRHLVKTLHLPFHHRDPFDRLIISQAMTEHFVILSNDNIFDKYEAKRIW